MDSWRFSGISLTRFSLPCRGKGSRRFEQPCDSEYASSGCAVPSEVFVYAQGFWKRCLCGQFFCGTVYPFTVVILRVYSKSVGRHEAGLMLYARVSCSNDSFTVIPKGQTNTEEITLNSDAVPL